MPNSEPGTAHPPPDDVVAAGTPSIVKTAGAILLMAGVFGLLHVIQLWGIIAAVRGPFAVAPPAMALETAAAVVVGVGFARARAWAPWAALATAALLGITSGVWFLFAIRNGLFTLFGMIVPGMAWLALALCLVAKKPCEKAAMARKRLEQEGLELGI